MLQAEVWEIRDGKDARVGAIVYDGKKLATDPEDEPLLNEIIKQPVTTPKEIDPAKEPEAFVKALCKQYRSGYLLVGPAKEV
jgi:hypothetical protein